MPFTFYISDKGRYNDEEIANFRAAMEFGGEKVQNTYQFQRDISVDVKFEALDAHGGGATGRAPFLPILNELIYPSALAKQEFSEEEWENVVEANWDAVAQVHPQWSGRDIQISFCTMTHWYTGTDGNVGVGQCDFVSYVMHELHHGLGWFTLEFEEVGGENGRPKRMVRRAPDPEVCFEKYLCFLTTEDNYCPISPYFLKNQKDLSVEEQTLREEKLFRILTGGNVYFRIGEDNYVKLYAPPVWEEGTSIIHIDFNQDENAVTEPYDIDVFVKHTIRPQEQQVVTHMRDFNQPAPPECLSNLEPKIAGQRVKVYGHAANKTGSISDITSLKATKTITKKTNTKGRSKAIKNVQQYFKRILRLDVQFKARLQMVSFNTKKMKMFTAHQKKSGIVIHHRQDVQVDGVSLPIAVARQIRGPKTIRQRAAHPKYWYDIDIFVDKYADWDYTSTAQSASGFMGFQSTLLNELCEAFRFTNSSEYVKTKTDEKGNPTFSVIGRKLFLDRDFAKVWMRPTRAHLGSHLITSPVSVVDK